MRVQVTCWIVALTSCLSSLSSCEVEDLTVATFNVNYANTDIASICKTIREGNAGVVFLQETRSARLESRLLANLQKEYPHSHFCGHDGRYFAERFGLLSRWPLSEIQFDQPKHGLFGTLTAKINVSGQMIQLVNVHLTPFTIRRGSNALQAFRAVSAVEVQHKNEIERIRTRVDAQRPVLVCGDFNSLAGFIAPTTLTSDGFVDSLASVHETPDAHPTWKWPPMNPKIRFRIDYIFHSKHFTTTESAVVSNPRSDHSLLVSRLRLNDSN